MGIDGAAETHADLLPLGPRRNRLHLVGHDLHQGLEMRKTPCPKGLRQVGDQVVILAVAIGQQGIENPVGQTVGCDFDGEGQGGKLGHRLAEKGHQGAAAVLAAVEDAVGQRQELPGEVECLGRIVGGDLFQNGAALCGQIIGQGLALPPADPGTRFGQGHQPLADLCRSLFRTLPARQCQPQPSLGGGIAAADLDQQLGQGGGPQRLQVLGVEGGSGGHLLFPAAWEGTLAAMRRMVNRRARAKSAPQMWRFASISKNCLGFSLIGPRQSPD